VTQSLGPSRPGPRSHALYHYHGRSTHEPGRQEEISGHSPLETKETPESLAGFEKKFPGRRHARGLTALRGGRNASIAAANAIRATTPGEMRETGDRKASIRTCNAANLSERNPTLSPGS